MKRHYILKTTTGKYNSRELRHMELSKRIVGKITICAWRMLQVAIIVLSYCLRCYSLLQENTKHKEAPVQTHIYLFSKRTYLHFKSTFGRLVSV
jgi:hypothetical protein